ncbi:kelch-like protein 30 isoform X1 [Portunus trituberculatus]|uniref:kelch-like protein 30 isoform X1 n=1 Tax=Portunus trituberculatus TaxID=210409 RepID=UPI001E1CD963|nr:kelch-like protein 30 isoform X1 [Portunus trituberculatus]XP_045128597.1 kelch-like protein 30 isoform X1 [Portunus trituberculatus]XP_045128598.1 kelch-like protein 30 isoform X1 [Portunus trituberculatus]XP_045128599.1 kelch-like protein 30 isoform X1 [Portunus trituberculatus]
MESEASQDSDTVTLMAEGRHFLCKKTKLMNRSDYFKAMFSSNFSENDKKLIELQDIDADCLELLLQYVESGNYSIPNEGVFPLLQTAAMLQFSSVQEVCEQQMLSSLSCDSCLEVYFIASALGIRSLASAALTVATWNFENLAMTPQFQQLAVNELKEYISHPALHPGTSGEWGVWEALVSWIEVCEEERAQHLVELLLCLDLHGLTQEDLANMLFFSVVSDSEEAVQLLECVKAFKSKQCTKKIDSATSGTSAAVEENTNWIPQSPLSGLSNELRDSLKAAFSKPGRRLPRVPCVVGFKQNHTTQRRRKAKDSDDEDEERHYSPAARIKNLDITPVLFSFDPVHKRIAEELTLSKLCYGPVQCSGYQVCAVGPSIYILGGEYQLGYGNWNTSLWRYSTASRKWIVEDSLPQPRRHFMSCVIDSTIYLLGGFGRHRVIQSSVDSYNTASGEWLPCPDMPYVVSHAAVCGFEGQLLVFTQEMQLLIYCPSLKKWSSAPLKSPNTLGYRAALPWKQYIYLIDNCSPQVYRFMPKEGTTVITYGQFTAPPINVCVVDGILYNFSHDDLCDGRVVETMELEGGDMDTEGRKDSGGKEDTPQPSSSGPIHSKEKRGRFMLDFSVIRDTADIVTCPVNYIYMWQLPVITKTSTIKYMYYFMHTFYCVSRR